MKKERQQTRVSDEDDNIEHVNIYAGLEVLMYLLLIHNINAYTGIVRIPMNLNLLYQLLLNFTLSSTKQLTNTR